MRTRYIKETKNQLHTRKGTPVPLNQTDLESLQTQRAAQGSPLTTVHVFCTLNIHVIFILSIK